MKISDVELDHWYAFLLDVSEPPYRRWVHARVVQICLKTPPEASLVDVEITLGPLSPDRITVKSALLVGPAYSSQRLKENVARGTR